MGKIIAKAISTTSIIIALGATLLADDSNNILEYYTVLKASNSVACDGKLKEWESALPIPLTNRKGEEGLTWKGGGKSDLSAKLRMLYDDNYLYIAVDVEDNEHSQAYSGPEIWRGDSVQIAFDTMWDAKQDEQYDDNDYEYGFSLTSKGAEVCLWNKKEKNKLAESVKFAAIKKKGGLVYEMAFPWSSLTPLKPTFGRRFGITLIVNDNDGAKRKGWLQWTDGIGAGKNPVKFATAVFLPDNLPCVFTRSSICPQNTFYQDNQEIFLACSINSSKPFNCEKKFIVKKDGKILKSIQSKLSLKKGQNPVLVSWSTGNLPSGKYNLNLSLLKNDNCISKTNVTINKITKTEIVARVNCLREDWKRLQDLITKLKMKGLDAALPTVTSTVVKVTLPIVEKDMSKGKLPKVEHLVACLEEALVKEISETKAILEGKKRNIKIPEYPNDKFKIKDGFFTSKNRPVILMGTMGGYNILGTLLDPESRNDLRNLGFNITEFSTAGPRSFFPSPDAVSKTAVYGPATGKKKGWKKYDPSYCLKLAEQGNLAVSLLLSIHQFPKWFYKKYPDSKPCGQRLEKGNFHADLPCLENSKARELYKEWIEKMVSDVKSSPALLCYDMANELTFFNIETSCPYCRDSFQHWLKNKYKSISKLNSCWAKSYKDFSGIMPPEKKDESFPSWRDWDSFWHIKNARFFKWMKKTIKNIDPDRPVFIEKYGVTALDRPSRNWGMDWESLGEVEDACGLDAVTKWENSKGTQKYAIDWQRQAMVYDLMKSWHPDKPIINAEYHFGNQRAWQKVAPQKMPKGYVRATCWTGSIHGLAAGIAWLYKSEWQEGRNEYKKQYNLLDTPDVLEEYGKTALELRRLSQYIAPFSQAKGKVFILHSMSSINKKSYRKNMDVLYEALYFEGLPVRFISEKQLRKDFLEKDAFFIIPQDASIEGVAYQKIVKWLNNGGRAAIIGKEALLHDEYDRKRLEDSFLKKIKNREGELLIGKGKIHSIPSTLNVDEYRKLLALILKDCGIVPKISIATLDDSDLSGIEYRIAHFNDKRLFYMINLSRENKKVKLVGSNVERIRDLVNEEIVKNVFSLSPLEPVLLELRN